MVQEEKTMGSAQRPDEPVAPSPVAAEAPIEEPGTIEVERTGHRKFISGVVEGFYGRPWTMEQRKELFRRQQKWGLNTYLYAPKDDYKHRMFWREMYSVEEAEQLMTLMASAKEHGIEFIYAISPGLDITFSNQKEVSTLKRKLDQVSQFGCKSFALLFDDIDPNMCPADKEVFSSFAHAQVSITNEIYQYLGEPETFLFCPTEYCGTFCCPSVSQSPYLRTVGEKLLPGIEVLWTGPKVVSKDITVESIEEVTKILKRAPVIWDNIHANDYDQKRLFLGPYKGRSTELIPRLKGVLTNPNCEFESNFVAIHTLATWYKSNMNGVRKDVVMTDGEDTAVSIQIRLENEGSDEELETDVLYSPQLALKLALTDWLAEFGEPHQYNSRQVPHSGPKSSAVDVASVTSPSLGSSTTVTTVYQQPIMSRVPAVGEGQRDPAKREPEEEPMETAAEKPDDPDAVAVADPALTEGAKAAEDLRPMDTDREAAGELASPEAPPPTAPEDPGGDVAPMQTDEQLGREPFVPGPGEKPLYAAEALTLEDLSLLAELFYLPYEHGPKAAHMLREFNWLRANSSVVSVNADTKDPDKEAEWHSRAEKFEEMCCSVIRMFTRLSNSANRTILYDLYPYIWDIKSIVSMVKSFVQWLGCRSQSSAQFLGGDPEPWAFRGGLAGELQRLLPIDGANDLFHQPPPSMPTSKTYSIRPYFTKDEAAVYKICREMYKEGVDGGPFPEQPDLIGDRFVGGLLNLSPDYGFVLEDEEGICGYALGTADVKPFAKKCRMSWIPSMQEKYNKPDCEKDLTEAEKMMLSFHEEEEEEGLPDSFLSNFPSLIKVQIHTKVTDPSVAKSMMGCLLSSLKASGSHGAFCEVRQTDKRMMDFYSKLGCFEVAKMEGFPKDVIIMGRSL
ncbi:protein O-GlcNAcase [Brienomyrus brachyistius]|uniref:protein O-GlcNAcase n=1 Tax=Brienomyrus brachyistius TaxID=42636 RepID=UPI0020B2864D|nr:protein O-GlcNAcase [Brienomyrus brachyistius]XP_048869367.1 protein O-GlcNAcase [Brienomyrus brachyistius]XP_048869368.1 protein O-GlcNAcase [Brienomyrus brachyistius]XP_048869369.1 protein O-GlcNAcase [Brienomyrus brachyistius]